jgi:hypothetical protein
LATDIFKSDEELFFKYLSQNIEDMEQYLEDPNKIAMDTLKSSPYTVKSNISFNLESADSQIAEQTTPPRNFSVAYTKNADPQNDADYSETKLKYLTKDIFSVQYVRNGDVHVVNAYNNISESNIFNVYLGIENNNLKQLAQKLGVQDVSNIPNKIENISLNELLSLTDEEKAYIQTLLISVVNNQISKDKFYHSKGETIEIESKQVKANLYGITLTNVEYKNFIVALLNEIEQNDNILNAILNKIYLVNSETDITISTIKKQIQNYITQLNAKEFNDGIKIQVYESEGKIVRTQIQKNSTEYYIIDNERANNSIRTIIYMNYTYGEKELTGTQNDIDEDEYQVIEGSALESGVVEDNTSSVYTIKKLEFAKQSSEGKNYIVAIATCDINDKTTTISIQNKTEQDSTNKNEFTNNIVIKINESDTTVFTITSDSNIASSSSVYVPTLEQGNYAVLNNLTKEYITQQLLPALLIQVPIVYNQQVEYVKEVQEQEDAQNSSLTQIDPGMLEMNTITNRDNIINQ